MLKNHLKIAWRNLWRRKLFTTVNLLGMTVGLTCVAFLFLCVQQMLSKDRFHRQLDRIFVVQTGEHSQNVFPLLEVMLREFPDIANGTRIQGWDAPWISYRDKEVSERITYVDTGFFQVFTFPLRYGNPATALQHDASIVLSAETAQKLFGDEMPLGKTVAFHDNRRFTVTGVMQPVPPNATLRPAVLLNTGNLKRNPSFAEIGDWYNTITENYVLLKPGVDKAKIDRQLTGVVKRYFGPESQDRVLTLLPYAGYAKKFGELNYDFYVYGLSCVAIFILLIVGINLVNLNMAVSFTRIQEVGIRKVLGSGRGGIMAQFFTETGLVVAIALLLSWIAAILLLPLLNKQLNGMELTAPMLYSPVFTGGWLLIGLVLTLGAGGYPAAYVSALKLAGAIRGRAYASPQRAFTRQALIVAQFVIAVVFITGSLVIRNQVRYMKEADVRFDKEQVLTAGLWLDFKDTAQARSGINQLIQQLRQHTAVAAVSTSQQAPGRFHENYNQFLPDPAGRQEVRMRQTTIDEGFMPTYGIKILQGRNFSPDLATDDKAVLINRTAMKALGWTSIAGKTLWPKGDKESYRVIGVTDDYHYRSLAGEIEPLLHFYGGRTQKTDSYGMLNIRVKPRNAAAVIALLEKSFSKMPSRRPFSYQFADEVFDQQYRRIEGIWALISFFTIVSVLIACAGIFALVALAVQQRTREIGVRKVLGAGIRSIVLLLSKDLIKLVGIAILLGAPLAWWIMHRWLQDFAYRINISWWMLAGAGIMAIAVAVLTVSMQSVKAALMNPAKALRTE